MLLLAFVFLVPAYYLLKAKGYRPAVFLWPAIMVAFAVVGITSLQRADVIVPSRYDILISAAFYLPSIFVLVLSAVLPKRSGAPGMSYLRITSSCPYCKQTITFRREREGLADLCPKCGEIVSVPLQPAYSETKRNQRTSGLRLREYAAEPRSTP